MNRRTFSESCSIVRPTAARVLSIHGPSHVSGVVVSELVREHSLELFDCEGLHQRQPHPHDTPAAEALTRSTRLPSQEFVSMAIPGAQAHQWLCECGECRSFTATSGGKSRESRWLQVTNWTCSAFVIVSPL